MPSNPNIYKAKEAFNDLTTLHWIQGQNKSVQINDIIYIYESKPTQAVILKVKVIDRDVTKYSINDSKYSPNHTDFNKREPWFTLKLIKQLKNPVPMTKLTELGVAGNIQSLRKISDDIVDEIEAY